ncbi:hypothetical protein MJO28_000815, partial [Puccinia striiformis f. sp. tritici]
MILLLNHNLSTPHIETPHLSDSFPRILKLQLTMRSEKFDQEEYVIVDVGTPSTKSDAEEALATDHGSIEENLVLVNTTNVEPDAVIEPNTSQFEEDADIKPDIKLDVLSAPRENDRFGDNEHLKFFPDLTNTKIFQGYVLVNTANVKPDIVTEANSALKSEEDVDIKPDIKLIVVSPPSSHQVVEANKVFSQPELVDFFYNLGEKGIFQGMLTPGKLDWFTHILSKGCSFSHPVTMVHIESPEGPIPANYIVHSILQKWMIASHRKLSHGIPEYITVQGLQTDENGGDRKAGEKFTINLVHISSTSDPALMFVIVAVQNIQIGLVGFFAGTASNDWTWTLLYRFFCPSKVLEY